ncbi:MAG: DUF2520 domain-containing protein [Ignavibacteriales bacterium]|nr:DUF2520 domain-containing protein [Ignavibacteriales bacterium]
MKKHQVTIVGAGTVGNALGLAFRRAGIPVRAIYSRTFAHARSLARKTDARWFSPLGAIERKISGVVFIAVADDAIKEAVCLLADTQQQWNGVTVLHTSGALASSELSVLKKRGAAIGSFHPLQTFPKKGTPATLQNVRVCVEGDAHAAVVGQSLALAIGASPFVLRPRQKILYHIAAVFGSNYLVTLLSVVEELGNHFGLDEKSALQLFEPLITATLGNVRRMGAAQALTGPIARWDVDTIRKHTDALSTKKFSDILSLYASLGLATARLASKHQGIVRRKRL